MSPTGTRRRHWLALTAAGLVPAAFFAGPARAQLPGFATRLRPAVPDALLRQREAWIVAGQAALREGDAALAEMQFERATQVLHAADSELAQVLAVMQRGESRRAAALAAHVAGVHRDTPAAAALYAWLLALSGQETYAQRHLEQALARLPGEPLLAATAAALREREWIVPPALRESAARAAPWPVGDVPAGPWRVRATACRLGEDDAALALAPAAACDGAAALALRDGLGRGWRAEPDLGRPAPAGLCWLRAAGPAPLASDLAAPVPRDAFPGSPAYALHQAVAGDDAPAWPQMRLGFLGGPDGRGGRRLGLAMPAGLLGAPVYNGDGRLVGLALGHDDGVPRLVPASSWREEPAPAAAVPASAPAARAMLATVAADELYERTLRQVLQLLVA